ncbi:MAG: hypothetical protein KDC87_13095 [Planctomycetes bacterium]|nr:hypothetical protein [Planctomycetota bacterium]MCB9889245.1 hypothetical protein [Planctomycetota bacterium]
MKLGKLIGALAIAVLVLPMGSCQSMQRASKDAFVVLTSPGLILMGASADAHAGAKEVRKGYASGGATEIAAFVPLFFYNFVKHTGYCLVHLLDLPLAGLVYPWAEIAQYGPEIVPLDYYQMELFDKPWNDRPWYRGPIGQLPKVETTGAGK